MTICVRPPSQCQHRPVHVRLTTLHTGHQSNLKLNVSKTSEIVFQNSTRRTVTVVLSGISREQFTQNPWSADHVQAICHLRKVISDSAQRASCTAAPRNDRGRPTRGLPRSCRVTADIRASPAWSGFITATDSQRGADVFRR